MVTGGEPACASDARSTVAIKPPRVLTVALGYTLPSTGSTRQALRNTNRLCGGSVQGISPAIFEKAVMDGAN